ncbi:MAG: PAS domain-containing protein [Proteobacteria bacterium]|nr:PAS domain-containing protein [Pseudomonadota bacterium]
MPTHRPSALPDHIAHASGEQLAQVDEAVWVDVIRQMDEVYARLVDDEVALEEKNAQLEASQQFIFSLLSSMSDVLIACRGDGAIEQTNAALCRLVGETAQALHGQPLQVLLADEASRERLARALASPEAQRGGATVEVALRGAQGQPVPVDLNCTLRRNAAGKSVGQVLVGRPMGEIKRAYHALREAHEALKRTQAQLLHSEKLASLGRLVAGVAHELNNPISFVLGNVHALERYAARIEQYLNAVHALPQPPELAALRAELRLDSLLADLPSLMEGTREGAQRTADIVGGLRRFSAIDREDHGLVELTGVVERAIHWVRKGTAPGFDITFETDGPAQVMGHAGQLLQVLMNLIQNASDAASGRSEPRLVIRMHRQGEQVQVELHDNGSGIAPEHLPRIFDPFFTTKGVGKGTGLGLSISYGIAERHGGTLTGGNHPAGGACFRLTLPLAAPLAVSQPS